MNPTHSDESRILPFPDMDLLRRDGWSVAGTVGQYCVAFRGAEEVVFAWRQGEWRVVGVRTTTKAA